ncbi:zinc carboxypeptidase A 1-like [Anopheles coustani]|uniref:zinc carboxypeptidase A 1-like n=1 Tax=Anopheles coustani TaxID=139045 RepID=UPI002657D3F1|nr:zinc carboxypeptidase A 1-like [Anopheles coustani]
MASFRLVGFFLCLVAVCFAEPARYDNYRVYKLSIERIEQLELLQLIEQSPDGYAFLSDPVHINTTVKLVVPPHKVAEFAELNEKFSLKAEVAFENLQAVIDRQLKGRREVFGWTAYHTLEDIYGWLDTLIEQYPSVVSPIVAGQTYEGRQIRGVKVSYKAGNPAVFTEGTIHAREWISAATVTFVLNELLTSVDPAVRNIAENYDWYVVPVANPDGYVYTHTTTRLWRKTRSQQNVLCFGADPNRNWDFMFNQGGTSTLPCSDTFSGPYPFSEIETLTLSQYINTIPNLSTYLDFHSSGQLLMVPYGHTREPLDNYNELMEIGRKAIAKLQERHGSVYQVGNIAEIIYVASGSSLDWVKGTLKTPLTFAYELRDRGEYGFLLPPDQIIATAEETLDSIIVILEEGKAMGYHYMKFALVYLALALLCGAAVAEKARYDNYRVYRVRIETDRQLELLKALEQNPDGYRFWDEPVKVGTQVLLVVPPHQRGHFGEIRAKLAFRAELHIADLQKQIDLESRTSLRKESFGWTAYYRTDEIYAWLDSLVASYPGVVSPLNIGNSYEGRPIKGVKVSYKAGNKAVVMESLIHAREWISGATTTYVLNQLLTSTDPKVRNIAENFDWYFFPVTNPDGYEYTHTTDRQWRKTRSEVSILCRGADPNRNWGYNFMQGGASNVPCSDTFAGPSAFSEVETLQLSNFIATLDNMSTYLSFHAYSQLLLIPYGHTTARLDNYDEAIAIGTKAINKLQERYGTTYKIGNIAEAIYVASGGSIDWVKGVLRTPLVYCYELRDLGRYGFVLPPDQIIPTAEETLDSIIVILEEGQAAGIH